MFSTKFLNAAIASACVAAAINPVGASAITATAGQPVIAATLGGGYVGINPKKPGSLAAARFALYRPGITAQAYVAACVAAGHSRRNATADLTYDTRHGFITLAR